MRTWSYEVDTTKIRLMIDGDPPYSEGIRYEAACCWEEPTAQFIVDACNAAEQRQAEPSQKAVAPATQFRPGYKIVSAAPLDTHLVQEQAAASIAFRRFRRETDAIVEGQS